MGWARATLHLVGGARVEPGTWRESLAIGAWRKQQRIETLRTIAVVVATTNAEKAQQALNDLLAETFPEIAKDREKSVDKALEIMKRESKMVYTVKPLDEKKGSDWIKRARAIRSTRK